VKQLKRYWPYLVIFLLVLGVVGFGFGLGERAQLRIAQLQPLPQLPQIQVYLNHSQAHSYAEPYRSLTRSGDDLEQVMLKAIATAQSSIDVAVQEFRLPKLAQALVERQRAGVKVRVVLENTYTAPWATFTDSQVKGLDPHLKERYQAWKQLVDLNQDGNLQPAEIAQRDVLTLLNQSKIPWLDDTADGSQGSLLMHHKFIVIDGQTLVATTANFTISDLHGDLDRPDTRGNANSLLLISSPDLATLFTQEFNYLWGDGPGGQPNSRFGINKPLRPTQRVQVGAATVAVKFSPAAQSIPWEQTTNGLIGASLNQAQASIDMALFVFSDQALGNTLELDHQRGVEVRLLVDPSFVYRDFSEALDMLGLQLANTGQARQGNCTYEAGNHPWRNPIATVGTPALPEGDKLHHKFGVLDAQTVIVGSHNWSEAANRGNDEFLLVIENPTVAAHYEREFDRLYASSRLGAPAFLTDKIAQQLKQCGGVIQTRAAATAKRSGSAKRSDSPRPAPIVETTGFANQRINVNTASQAELEALPGVGPKLAETIIATRTQKPFSSLADLDAVPGIGPKLLTKIQDRITW
jgi:competence ComEA-like helix-hairpin-helix protein